MTALLFTCVLIIAVLGMCAGYYGLKANRNPMSDAADVLTTDVTAQIAAELASKFEALLEYDDLVARKAELEVKVRHLEDEMAESNRLFERKRQELDHAAGLLRKELDAELKRGKTQSGLDAERTVLEAERKFNERELEARKQSFEQQLTATKEITDRLFQLVPNLEAKLNLRGKA